jgi:hypothetical protein
MQWMFYQTEVFMMMFQHSGLRFNTDSHQGQGWILAEDF